MLIPWSRVVRFSALGNSRRYWHNRIAIRSTSAKGTTCLSRPFRGRSALRPTAAEARPSVPSEPSALAEAGVLRTALSRADLAGPFCSSLKLPARYQGTGRRSCPALHERATCSIRGVLPVCLIYAAAIKSTGSAGPPHPMTRTPHPSPARASQRLGAPARYDVPGSAERAEERHRHNRAPRCRELAAAMGDRPAARGGHKFIFYRSPPCLERPERPRGKKH
jgi:hypothetical protein